MFTASLPVTTIDMPFIFTTAFLGYSYIDHGKVEARAGPEHLKLKPMSKIVAEKEVVQVDYDIYDVKEDKEELQGMLEELSLLLTVPKKSVKLVDKTLNGCNRERSILPGDLYCSGHELVSLKAVDNIGSEVSDPYIRVPTPDVNSGHFSNSDGAKIDYAKYAEEEIKNQMVRKEACM